MSYGRTPAWRAGVQ